MYIEVKIEMQYRTSTFIDNPKGKIRLTLVDNIEVKGLEGKFIGLEIRISKFFFTLEHQFDRICMYLHDGKLLWSK